LSGLALSGGRRSSRGRPALAGCVLVYPQSAATGRDFRDFIGVFRPVGMAQPARASLGVSSRPKALDRPPVPRLQRLARQRHTRDPPA
jgi:hypothetical protein